MDGPRQTTLRRSRWRWLLLPLAPILGPLLLLYVLGLGALLLAFGLGSAIWLWAQDIRLAQRMSFDRRRIRSDELEAELAAGRGTLILERPYLGWGSAHLWFTEDDVAVLSPVPIPSEGMNPKTWAQDHGPFAKWIMPHYLDRTNGIARLRRARSGHKVLRRLRRKYPDLKCVTAMSFLAYTPEFTCADCGHDLTWHGAAECPACGTVCEELEHRHSGSRQRRRS